MNISMTGLMGCVLAAAMLAGGMAWGAEEDVGAELAKAKLFAGLTDAERDALRPAVTVLHGKAEDRVIEYGKKMSRMLIILQGKAEVRVGEKVVATLADQPLVGEIEFLDGNTASANVFLSEDSLLLAIDNEKLNAVFEEQPKLGYLIMREIAKIESARLRQTNEK